LNISRKYWRSFINNKKGGMDKKMIIPEHLALANLPTKIEKLERLTAILGGPNIYIKRDDQTGTEYSGNKIRKLEFSVKEALDRKCNVLITCGGIQSNHCRATAAIAAKLGLKSCLVLRYGDEKPPVDGNYFLDRVLGADIKIISPDDYKNKRQEIMESIKKEYDSNGYNAYIIPEGASNGIGTFGYFNCMKEIKEQEKELGIEFDTIVLTIGSGGTYAGMVLANKIFNTNKRIVGVNICDNEEIFRNRVKQLIEESKEYLKEDVKITDKEINIIDGYVGRGYALSRKEEIEFIYDFGKLEGIVLDPVYTGKCMYGLIEEIKKGKFNDSKNILFIHTGGLFGLFPSKNLFEFKNI